MATSFRLPPEQRARLDYLAKRLGKSKTQVVQLAIDFLYEKELSKSPRSALDKLMDGGFIPMAIDLDNIAGNEQKQRQVIRARLAKKSSS